LIEISFLTITKERRKLHRIDRMRQQHSFLKSTWS